MKFKATIEKTEVTTEIVEIDATSMREAARRLADYCLSGGSRRGITVVRPYDQGDMDVSLDVVKIEER